MADIEQVVADGVAMITLNRAGKSNAFTVPMLDQLATWLAEARTDCAINVVVLGGAGRNFCAGADRSMFQTPPAPLERKERLRAHMHRVALAHADLDVPTIALVRGAAMGAGMDLALMCDLRIAGTSARFAESYVRLGLVPGDGGAYYLPRIVGVPKALELLCTGDVVDAEEALRIGLANRVVDDGDLEDEGLRLARRLAEMPPISLRMIKRSVYQSSTADLRTSLDLVSSHMAVVQTTKDTAEALRAAAERRQPRFVNE